MTPRDAELRRGEQARRLLEDPLLREAFAAVEAGLRERWLATAEEAAHVRERLWLSLRLLRQVQGYLQEAVTTGKLAALTEVAEQ
jgi:hypothetical protein